MKEYIQIIIWVMLFVIVIEMIFPDSNYRKYLKLVLGCIVVYVLFQPAVQIFIPDAGAYDYLVKAYEAKFTGSATSGKMGKKYQEELTKQRKILEETYKETIKHLVEKETDTSVVSCNVEIDEGEDYGRITKIELTVTDKKEEKVAIAIPRIRIGSKSNTVYGNEEKLKNKIKTCLKNFYIVQDCNIYITVQKND